MRAGRFDPDGCAVGGIHIARASPTVSTPCAELASRRGRTQGISSYGSCSNNRESDTIVAMVVMNLVIGSALRYEDLTAKVTPPQE